MLAQTIQYCSILNISIVITFYSIFLELSDRKKLSINGSLIKMIVICDVINIYIIHY